MKSTGCELCNKKQAETKDRTALCVQCEQDYLEWTKESEREE